MDEHIIVRANFYAGWITTGYDIIFRDEKELLAAIEMLRVACGMWPVQYERALTLAEYARDKTR